MVRNFNEMDEGKRIVTDDGQEIGTVTSASGSRLHVDPANDLSQSVRRRLGWSEDEDNYELRQDHVEEITDDEIRIKSD